MTTTKRPRPVAAWAGPPTPSNRTYCRYLNDTERCTAEAVHPDAPILLCPRHLADAVRTANNAFALIAKETP